MIEPGSAPQSLLRALRGTGFRPPAVRLPPAAQVVDPGGRFAFEIPWPWYEASPGDLAESSPLGSWDDSVAVIAPRTDGGDPVFVVSADPDQVDMEAAGARSRGRSHAAAAGVRWTSTSKLLVGGARALLTEGVSSRTSGMRTFLLFAPNGDVVVTGRCDVPALSADGYRQHLLSMLASWTWPG